MPRVTTIPATITKYGQVATETKKKRRVAAYARVSTDHEEQQSSYEAQIDYYTNYIKQREDWEFAGLYADEGTTGCNTKKRDGFNKMVSDALSGKFDLLLTKSVSRFARNTVDSLSTIRKLKDKKVECYFEKENIWTFDGKGELLITIMSSLAQEESRSISENCVWGQRKRFADGKVTVPFARFLGYDRGPNGELVLNKDEAEIIKFIYTQFLKGFTPPTIAKQLDDKGIKTPGGKDRWHGSTIRSILSNEKYKGDALLQKTFTVSFLTKEKKKNEGEVPQYYVEKNHEAIISDEVFDRVQNMLVLSKKIKNKNNSSSIFSGKVICGDCGGYYGSKVWHSNDKYKRVVFRCNNKFDGESKCKTPTFNEEQLKEIFVKAFNKLVVQKQSIIQTLELLINSVYTIDELKEKQQELEEKLVQAAECINELINENAKVVQDQTEYTKNYQLASDNYMSIENELNETKEAIQRMNGEKDKITALMNKLKDTNAINEFDEDAFIMLVENYKVYTEDKVVVIFKDGTEIEA